MIESRWRISNPAFTHSIAGFLSTVSRLRLKLLLLRFTFGILPVKRVPKLFRGLADLTISGIPQVHADVGRTVEREVRLARGFEMDRFPSGLGDRGRYLSMEISVTAGIDALLDYSIFHIGVYLTLGATLIAAEVFWKRKSILLPISVFFLIIAGAAGGIVASNIPASATKNYETFLNGPALWLFDRPLLFSISIRNVIAAEHISFWIAILLLLGKFFVWRLCSSNTATDSDRTAVANGLAAYLGQWDTRLNEHDTAIGVKISQVRESVTALVSRIEQLEQNTLDDE